jgi:hypothetical protein
MHWFVDENADLLSSDDEEYWDNYQTSLCKFDNCDETSTCPIRLVSDIKEVDRADFLFVLCHWENEYSQESLSKKSLMRSENCNCKSNDLQKARLN